MPQSLPRCLWKASPDGFCHFWLENCAVLGSFLFSAEGFSGDLGNLRFTSRKCHGRKIHAKSMQNPCQNSCQHPCQISYHKFLSKFRYNSCSCLRLQPWQQVLVRHSCFVWVQAFALYVLSFRVVADHQSLIDLLHLARTTTSEKYLAP